MIKKIFSLSFGTALYQLLAFISLPYFALHYEISSFAEYGRYSAVLSIFSAFTLARFNQVLLISKGEEEVFKSLVVGFSIAILTSGIFTFALSVFSNSLYFKFIIISLLAFGMFELFSSLAIKNNQHKYVSYLFIFYGIITISVQFCLIGVRENGVIEGKIFGDLILFMVSFIYVLKSLFRNRRPIDKSFFQFFIKNKAFYLYGCTQGFISSFSRNLPLLILPSYDEKIAGYFSILYKLIAAPVDFLAKPIRQVILNLQREEINLDYFERLGKIFKLIVIVFSVLAISLFFFDWELILINFFNVEHEWGEYWLVIVLLLMSLVQVLIFTPIKTFMINANLQKELLLLEIIFSLIKLTVISLCFIMFNAYYAIVLYLMSLIIVDNAFVAMMKPKVALKFNEK